MSGAVSDGRKPHHVTVGIKVANARVGVVGPICVDSGGTVKIDN